MATRVSNGNGTTVNKVQELTCGIQIETTINHDALWDRMVEHYSRGQSALWECPWCGGHIDALCDEISGDDYWDTWDCVGGCDLLITFITPAEYAEYHCVPDDYWRVLVEGAFGDDWEPPGNEEDEGK
jgi:hypothetical protein